jgi:signal transduction histidine kinase
MLKHWEELFHGKGYSDVEFILVTKTGQEKWCSSTWGPIFDETGRQVGVQGRERDITPRKELERQILEISAAERRHLAAELHDSLGQSLTGIALRVKSLEETLVEDGLTEPAAAVAAIVELTNQTIHQTRSLAHGLDPVHLDSTGIVSALQNLATQTPDLFRVECAFNCSHKSLPLRTDAGLALYRIAQEAIRNAIAHGKATRLQVDLSLSGDQLTLSICDNGSGFSVGATAPAGLGLHTMRYRANAIGGRLTVESEPGLGTCVRCVASAGACLQPKPEP